MKNSLTTLRRLLVQLNAACGIDFVGKFLSKSHAILLTIQDVLSHLKQVHNYAETFANKNGHHSLIGILDVARKVFQYEDEHISPKTKEAIHFAEQIEHSVLLCTKYLATFNQAIILENDFHLRTLFGSISSTAPCQVALLETLAVICTPNVDKVLDTFTWYSVVSKENARFKCLFHLLNSGSTFCVENTLNLINQIMMNVSLTERIRIQSELEEIGITRNMVNKQIGLSGSEEIQEKVAQFNCLYVDISRALKYESINQTTRLHQKVRQLNEAFTQLECEKRNLLQFESLLKQKCDNLMKNYPDLKSHKFSLISNNHEQKSHEGENQINMQSEESEEHRAIDLNKTTICADIEDDISLDYYNMKSSEEEIVCASVLLPQRDFIPRKNEPVKEYSLNANNSIQKSRNSLSHHGEPCFSSGLQVNMHSNYARIQQNSKYFCYIKDNVNTIGNGHRSIRKSISKMFKLNRKSVKSNDSICSINGSMIGAFVEGENCKQDLTRRSTCSLSCNDSVKSFSLPNAFRSNFILRKNMDMFFSQSHLCSETFDSISSIEPC